ncbi:hypothetical protein [Kutzneria buriramensis]|uniref:Uncharacterized protein n=1 Tax=Kutzneria buriramensis TaxID=1045776 RepID=A0A3E0HEH5_9PSEU|nr:hypothetical protein [Kutzneria buriramensis]REH43642.1 hypothetical protein BCF44_109185 [Kutzneria buriramensis]
MAYIFFQGQDVPLAASVVNDSGTPANATTVTLTVTNPDGTTQTPAVSNQGTGSYTAVVPAVAQTGVYLYRWTATGSGFSWASEGQFQTRASAIELMVDLPSVKAHLNMPLNDTSQDDELQGFILAAEPIVEDLVGTVMPKTYVEYFNGASETVVLSHQPVISIQSVYEYYGLSAFLLTEQPLGAQMNAFAFTVDYTTGQLLRRTFGGQAARFAIGDKNIKVSYTAGLTTVAYNIRLGTLELLRHWWQLTQQGRRPTRGGGDGGDGHVPTGFAVPDRVVELLQPQRRPPGVA